MYSLPLGQITPLKDIHVGQVIVTHSDASDTGAEPLSSEDPGNDLWVGTVIPW